MRSKFRFMIFTLVKKIKNNRKLIRVCELEFRRVIIKALGKQFPVKNDEPPMGGAIIWVHQP